MHDAAALTEAGVRVVCIFGEGKLLGGPPSSANSRIERLIEVADDVVDVFDADTEPHRLGFNPGLALFFNRHLSMSGRGRMAGQRFGITDIHEPLDQLESVIELLAGLEPSLDPKGHQRAAAAAEIFLREGVIRTFREPR